MATHRESRTIARPPEEIFDIVADVERYPEFLPLIREARIFRRHENAYETEQSLALGLMTHRFRTRTMLDRPRGITVVSDAIGRSAASTSAGSLRRSATTAATSTSPSTVKRIHLFLMPVIQMLVLPMAVSMVAAFEARAHMLAGDTGGRASPSDS
jgi:coenzyme Q-binding protein COQ10